MSAGGGGWGYNVKVLGPEIWTIVNQRNIGTVEKAALGKLLRERDGAIMGFFMRIDTILN